MVDYLASIHDDSRGLAEVVRRAHLGTPVPSCPGWDLRHLAAHVGWVQRWARLSAATAARPDEALIEPAPEGSGDDLADWLEAGSAALVDTLATLVDDAPTWHPFPVPQLARVWPRRQAHEVCIHRWDAEAATGQPGAIEPERSTDYIREYFEVVVPRVVTRDGRIPPQGDLLVQCTDSEAVLAVRVNGSTVTMISPSSLVDPAGIVGTGSDVLLALWRRAPLPTPASGAAAQEWLDFGGN